MSAPAILCVGLNPALDVTYSTAAVHVGQTHRVEVVRRQAGGKATNVARVARILGARVHLVLPVGGEAGAAVRADLDAAGVDYTSVEVGGLTRTSVAVVDADGEATVFNETGSAWDEGGYAAVFAATERLLPAYDVVVLTGSTPPGLRDDAYAALVAAARRVGVASLVDAHGPVLRAALAAGPTMVKPNAAELRATVGVDGPAGLGALRQLAPGTIALVSAGEDGLLWAADDGWWSARPGRIVQGNPTGAGDAAAAALAIAMATRAAPEAALRLAVGASGAAVLDPVAGHVDRGSARELAQLAIVNSLVPVGD